MPLSALIILFFSFTLFSVGSGYFNFVFFCEDHFSNMCKLQNKENDLLRMTTAVYVLQAKNCVTEAVGAMNRMLSMSCEVEIMIREIKKRENCDTVTCRYMCTSYIIDEWCANTDAHHLVRQYRRTLFLKLLRFTTSASQLKYANL